jgi:phosphoketolase
VIKADSQYIDPAESGAVIPILHANGYKIGERTITGAMDNLEVREVLGLVDVS